MGRLLATATILALSLGLGFGSAHAASPAATGDELRTQAEQLYAARSYDAAGVVKTEQAAQLFEKLAQQSTDAAVKLQALVSESEALYFAGDASNEKSKKIQYHDRGYKVADGVVKELGVADVTSVSDADLDQLLAHPEKLELLATALYARGTNLAQWGQANGVQSSLGKWPELRSNMELIGYIGMDRIHEYGANRTLGRAYFALPAVLGGSVTKAETYLKTAVDKTPAPGGISTNGFNNLYYAEVLKYEGKTALAKSILTTFVAADPGTLSPGNLVETKLAQELAKADLKKW